MRLVPALVVLLSASPAMADVIPADYRPPPCEEVTCPPGARPIGRVSHGGCSSDCGPTRVCQSDADCQHQGRCAEARFCVARVLQGRAGELPTVVGECGEDDTCEHGHCSVERRCVLLASEEEDDGGDEVDEVDDPSSAGPASGQGDAEGEDTADAGACSVTPGGRGSSWALLLPLGLVLVRLVRRGRRGRRARSRSPASMPSAQNR